MGARTPVPQCDGMPSTALLLQPRPNRSFDVSNTPSSRNRAIDAYRAVAMCAVAVGHWLAADVRTTDGSLTGGNALDKMQGLHILTWVFQVMPL